MQADLSTPPRGVSSYAVEEAIWGVFCGCWLIVRNSVSPSTADTCILVLPSLLAFANLALSSLFPILAKYIEIYFFQFVFGYWLASFTTTLDIASLSKANSLALSDTWLSMVSLAVSLALSTIQMLLSAAAVSPDMWKCKPPHLWADLYTIAASTFQGLIIYALSPGIFFGLTGLNLLVLAATLTRIFTLNSSVLLFAVPIKKILEIVSFTLETITLVTSLALSYLYGTTNFGSAIGLVVAMTALTLRLVTTLLEGNDNAAAPHTGDTQPTAPPETALKSTSSQDRDAQQQQEPAARASMHSHASFPQLSSRVAGDALLFSKTKALSSRLKKNC